VPIYTYRCPRCGCTTEKTRKVEERNQPVPCAECPSFMEAAPASPAPYFPGAATWRGGR
jgi:putative FmdB family regulatory protein